MTHPSETLAAAAQRLRSNPTAAYDVPLAAWLDVAADRFKTWQGPHVPAELGHALAVANAVPGQSSA